MRTTLKIAGESGMGLASVGSVIAKTLKKMNFFIHLDREYPSLIKGGHSNVQIDFGPEQINCLRQEADIVVALDRAGLEEYLGTIKEGGILIHGYERHALIKDLESRAKKRKVKLLYLPARQIAYSFGGNELMTNMVLLGLLWKVLGLSLEELKEEVRERYGKKPEILAIDLKCLDAGYQAEGIKNLVHFGIEKPLPAEARGAKEGKKKLKTLLLDGNHAICLGAIHAGARAYYAYPMSPSSSILTYMANWGHDTGMLIKQGEDEITVAQMALGSMFAGTRALAATSGGGYDLMTETVSLAAMIESPLVIVVAQRPGPATGLPTWTAQGDLNLALYSSHGEFPRVVVAVSDPTSAFEQIQHAFNFAEVYQVPVIVLTEKVIAESQTMVAPFAQKKIPIKRGLVTSSAELQKLQRSDRYKITTSGISKRWNPGSSEAFYFANSDEHWADGTLTETGEQCGKMQEKRMKKHDAIAKEIPEPKIYGDKKKADISFVGWGSSKGTVLDAMKELKQKKISVNYLHYEYLWPFKDKTVRQFFKDNNNIHLIEGNYIGQLGNLIEQHTSLKFKHRYLKYNGRPFFLEEVVEYAKKNS